MSSYMGFVIIVITISSLCISSMCFSPIDHDSKNVPSPKNNNNEINNQTRVSRASNGLRKSQAACNQYISSASSTRTSIGDHVTHGNDAKLGEFPHMAQIGYPSMDVDNIYPWQCGGSLISNRFVLTAAHCMLKVSGETPSRVRFGFVDLDFTNNTIPQEVRIKNVIVHPEYNRRSKENDIALIELDNEVQMDSSTYPACLYQSSDNFSDLLITGWGRPGTATSRILQKALVEAIPLDECSKFYSKLSSINITNNHNIICSLSLTNISTNICQGSSGSPLQKLISRNSSVYGIVGVLSYGLNCDEASPRIFAKVSSYLDWIDEIVWS